MSQLKIIHAPGENKYLFSGPIDEHFEMVINESEAHFIFDLKEINQINSVGILKLIKFLQSLSSDKTISFINVPDFVVNVMSLTQGIVSPRFKVESFFIPFYSSEKDVQEYKLFHSKDILKPFVSPYRDADGHLFEVDTNLERYLHFLNFQK